jgi:hypothetical protein
MTEDTDLDRILLTTMDPELRPWEGGPTQFPALTTLMFRVCDGDEARFLEACRLVELFIARALEVGRGE